MASFTPPLGLFGNQVAYSFQLRTTQMFCLPCLKPFLGTFPRSEERPPNIVEGSFWSFRELCIERLLYTLEVVS